MSVNISPQQLAEPGFVDLVVAVLDETGFPADKLWLEITEGALLRDPPAAIATLRALRAQGVHLAIDDFGTGYSSLSYLRRLPVEALKIDRSFVEHLESESEDRAIVEAIVALGRTLGLEWWPRASSGRARPSNWPPGVPHRPGLPLRPAGPTHGHRRPAPRVRLRLGRRQPALDGLSTPGPVVRGPAHEALYDRASAPGPAARPDRRQEHRCPTRR